MVSGLCKHAKIFGVTRQSTLTFSLRRWQATYVRSIFNLLPIHGRIWTTFDHIETHNYSKTYLRDWFYHTRLRNEPLLQAFIGGNMSDIFVQKVEWDTDIVVNAVYSIGNDKGYVFCGSSGTIQKRLWIMVLENRRRKLDTASYRARIWRYLDSAELQATHKNLQRANARLRRPVFANVFRVDVFDSLQNVSTAPTMRVYKSRHIIGTYVIHEYEHSINY